MKWLKKWISEFKQRWWYFYRSEKMYQTTKNLTREEKDVLFKKGCDIMFPNGYWECDGHNKYIKLLIAKGEKCHKCGRGESEVNNE